MFRTPKNPSVIQALMIRDLRFGGQPGGPSAAHVKTAVSRLTGHDAEIWHAPALELELGARYQRGAKPT